MFNSAKYGTATIASRREISSDLWVIRIRPDLDLAYRPGQYVTLGLERDDHVVERPYSISSDPQEDEIELFIERVPEGELTAPLHSLSVGATTLVRRRCKGLFLKDAPVIRQPHLLVATVTGVAPFVSMLRSLRRQQRTGEWAADHSVTVVQGASRSEELGYEDELRAMEGDCEWFSYVPTVSRPWEDQQWQGETGRVEDVLRKYADAAGLQHGHAAVYLCGNPQMISNCRGIMRRRGLDDAEIREEQYWPE